MCIPCSWDMFLPLPLPPPRPVLLLLPPRLPAPCLGGLLLLLPLPTSGKQDTL
jgi:hypothetical protein